MRRKTGEISVNGGNVLAVAEFAKKPLEETPMYPLALLIGEVLDMIAAGENIYLSIGTNKLKQAFLINAVWDGSPEREAFLSWDSLAEAAEALRTS